MNVKLRTGNPEKVGMLAQRVRHTANLAEGWVAQGIHPALVVLVARKGVVLHKAFGHLTPEKSSPSLELDAIFPLASISKTVTATAAMILVEQGLLGPNRPVSEYIPEFAGEGKDKVMVHHLLTHTSGLTTKDVDAQIEKKTGSVEIPPTDETQHPKINEYLFLGYDTPLTLPPGTEQRYGNPGINLLGEIVRRISDKSLADFARERLFEPLGMKDTTYIVSEPASYRAVKRPADGPLAWIDGREFQETPWAAIGAYSTAMDLAAFGQMFLNRGIYGDARILSPVTVAEMTRNQIPGTSSRFVDEFFPEAGTGFPWFIRENKKAIAYGETLQSSKTFCHGGAGGVFLWVDPVYEIVECYFSVDLGPVTVAEWHRHWYGDLFINAVMAAIVEV